MQKETRQFESGAIRDHNNKPSYEGFLSPLVLQAFAKYMHKKRTMPDGSVRGPDNWQAGMPKDVYIDSLLRHIIDLWLWHRGHGEYAADNLDDALAGIFFNVNGYWFEQLLEVGVAVRPKVDTRGSIGASITEHSRDLELLTDDPNVTDALPGS